MNTTTTHDPRGGGRPRLIFALGGDAQADAGQREFELLPGVTVIGSGADADLRLDGLDEHHAEVRRDAADEYLYVDLGTPAGSRVDGQPAGEQALRTGDRIELGHWTLSFFPGGVRRPWQALRRTARRRMGHPADATGATSPGDHRRRRQ